ncbi:hypothetical protein R2F25_26025 [Streptomyces sp. UP1A-1]|nr:hypothetical protein [Streptomyces sp. UP1A-1]
MTAAAVRVEQRVRADRRGYLSRDRSLIREEIHAHPLRARHRPAHRRHDRRSGAATATAFDGPPLHGDEDATCSPYFGAITTDSTGDLYFGGINCRSDDYDIDN